MGFKNIDFNTDFKMIPISALHSDVGYQREINGKVRTIVSEFDPDRFDPIKVNKRGNGIYYIVDGQNRTQAVRELAGDNCLIPAIVLHGNTAEREAELFEKQDDGKKGMTVPDKFKAAYFRKEKSVVELKRCTEAEGIECDYTKKASRNGAIICFAVAHSVLEKHGEIHYRKVLKILVDAWNGDKVSLSGNFIAGMSKFLETYPNIDERKLASALKKVDCGIVNSQAKISRMGGINRYAREFLRAYNRGKTKGALEDKII